LKKAVEDLVMTVAWMCETTLGYALCRTSLIVGVAKQISSGPEL
jgi:hypothetical protein